VLLWKLLNHVISLLSYADFTGSKDQDALNNTNSSHLLTKSSRPPNLHVCITSSLFNLLAALALHLSLPSLDHPHRLVMYNIDPFFDTPRHVSAGDWTPYFYPSTSSQSLYLWLAFSCSYHIFSCVDSLLLPSILSHSFTPGSGSTSFANLSHHRLFILASELTLQNLWLERLFWSSRFLLLILFVSLLFLFCFVSVWQIKLANRQLSESRKHSLAYCIVSHRVRLVLTVITMQWIRFHCCKDDSVSQREMHLRWKNQRSKVKTTLESACVYISAVCIFLTAMTSTR